MKENIAEEMKFVGNPIWKKNKKQILCVIGPGNSGKTCLLNFIDDIVNTYYISSGKFRGATRNPVKKTTHDFYAIYDIPGLKKLGISSFGDTVNGILHNLNILKNCDQIVCVANQGNYGDKPKAVADFARANGFNEILWFPTIIRSPVWRTFKFKVAGKTKTSYITETTKQLALDPILALL